MKDNIEKWTKWVIKHIFILKIHISNYRVALPLKVYCLPSATLCTYLTHCWKLLDKATIH